MSWTTVVSDTFSRANTTAGSAGSTTGVGNGWIDQAGSTWNISSDTLVGTTSNASGYNSQLLQRPSTEAALGQRITATFVYGGSSGNPQAQLGLCLRGQSTVDTYYLFNLAANTDDCYVYSVVSGGPTSIGGTTSTGSMTSGHTIQIDFYATGSSPTTLVFTVTDLTTSTVLCSHSLTDSTTALQSAGVAGLVVWVGVSGTETATFTSATTYTGSPSSGGTFTMSPSSIVGGSTGNTITVTGSGTSFNSPSSAPFQAAGGLGFLLSSQSVTSATAATLTVNAGLYGYGTVTITDTNGEETGTLTITEPSLGTIKVGFIGDSITYGTNGAPVTAFSTFLTGLGYTVTTNNQGQSGSSTNDWVVGDSDNYLSNAITAFNTAGVTIVHVMLGTNDARTPYNYTATQHFTRMSGIVAALVSAGFKVVISKPLYTVPNASFSGVVWPADCEPIYQAYFQMDMTLVDGVHVFQGDTANFSAAQLAPSTFLASDGVHPADATHNNITGQNWAIAVLQMWGNPNQLPSVGQLSTAARTAMVTAWATNLYAASGTPSMVLYSGTEPTNCGTGLAGNTVLASGNLATTASAQFSESSGVLSLATSITLTGQSGAGTGTTATFWRILDGAGTCQAQGTIGTTGASINLNSTNIVNAETVTISGLSLTMQNT